MARIQVQCGAVVLCVSAMIKGVAFHRSQILLRLRVRVELNPYFPADIRACNASSTAPFSRTLFMTTGCSSSIFVFRNEARREKSLMRLQPSFQYNNQFLPNNNVRVRVERVQARQGKARQMSAINRSNRKATHKKRAYKKDKDNKRRCAPHYITDAAHATHRQRTNVYQHSLVMCQSPLDIER